MANAENKSGLLFYPKLDHFLVVAKWIGFMGSFLVPFLVYICVKNKFCTISSKSFDVILILGQFWPKIRGCFWPKLTDCI